MTIPLRVLLHVYKYFSSNQPILFVDLKENANWLTLIVRQHVCIPVKRKKKKRQHVCINKGYYNVKLRT